MLNLHQVTLRRGSRLLLEGVTVSIHPGQKLGVTGANGAGKSSLLALIRGELEPDAGEVSVPPRLVIAQVAQETPAAATPAIEYVLQGDEELYTLLRQMAEAEAQGQGAQQAALHLRLEAIDGYTARSRAARLMHGLGFAASQEEQPVQTFSGGWRRRLNLARALMCRSDLLLLDEPTNHLDLDAVLWLEEWLQAYPGTLLLISHDRDFLDRIVDSIARIEYQSLRLYSGNYSAFEEQRAAQMSVQQAAYTRQQMEIARIQKFVDRFRTKATRARQAQSRLKALERMERIAPAHGESPFRFAFPSPEKTPSPLLCLREVTAGYGEKRILEGLEICLAPGDRIGLLGPNGAGKSTLLKVLAGELPPLSGRWEAARELRIGYFAQHQIERLQPNDSPLAHLVRLAPEAPLQSLRDFLGGFAFTGDMALEPADRRSGGERARLALALLVYQRPNLLLLDEPTNHLDLEMRHALSLALQDFPGAMMIVSHDRYLLRTLTDQLLLVEGRQMVPFQGDLDDYCQWLRERRGVKREKSPPIPPAGGAAARRERRRQAAEDRRRRQPLQTELQRLEKNIATLTAARATIEAQLAAPALYQPPEKDRLQALLIEQGQVERSLRAMEEAWLLLSEDLEGAGQEDRQARGGRKP